VYNSRWRERKSFQEVPEPLPVHVLLTGTTVQPFKPYPPYLMVEHRQGRNVKRYTVTGKMPGQLQSQRMVLFFPGQTPVRPAPRYYALYRPV
jgi:hypothetical protein